jgi:hypothetical protein
MKLKTKNLMSKSEAQKLTEIAKKIARSIGKIDALHQEARELVGFETTDVSFLEDDDLTWDDDPAELANHYISWCKSNRARWHN